MSKTIYLPSTDEIADEFASELHALGGVATDSVSVGDRLYARGTLATDAVVRPGDTVRGGIALRVSGTDVGVYPYIFRQICKNGAIQAEHLGSRTVSRTATDIAVAAAATGAIALGEIRMAIRSCAEPDAFAATTETLRMAADHSVNLMIQVLPMLAQHVAAREALLRHLAQINDQFEDTGDRSLYGIMNAVTSVARTTRDAETRWQLEVLGAAVGTLPLARTHGPVAGELVLTA